MKPKKIPSKEAKDSEVSKLRKRVKKLEKENARLKSENNTYEQAFKNTKKYIDDETENISVEKMIDAAKKGSKLKDVKKQSECPECGFVGLKEIKTPAGTVELCGHDGCKYRGKK